MIVMWVGCGERSDGCRGAGGPTKGVCGPGEGLREVEVGWGVSRALKRLG